MADINLIKRNISKMIEQNAPENDIDAYVASEGVTIDQLKSPAAGQNAFDERWKPLSPNMPGLQQAADKRLVGDGSASVAGIDSMANTWLLGAPRFAAAGLDSIVSGKPFAETHDKYKDMMAANARLHPVASGVGTGAGIVGQAFTIPFGAPGTIGGRLGLATGLGAGLSGTESLIENRGDLSKAGEDALYGGAGGLAGGTLFETGRGLYKGGKAVAGAFADGLSGAAAKKVALTTEKLFGVAGSQMNAARQQGVKINPQYAADFATRVEQKLYDMGISHGKAAEVVNRLQALKNAPGGSVLDMNGLDAFRAFMSDSARSADGPTRKAAGTVLNEMFDAFGNIPNSAVISGNAKGAVSQLRDGVRNWATAAKSDTIGQKATKAELQSARSNSGMNLGNTLKAKLEDIALKGRGFSPAEKKSAEDVVRGSLPQNAMRYFGNLLGGGGGLGQAVTAGGLVGAGTLGATGDPSTAGTSALAAALAGYGLKRGYNRSVSSGVKNLEKLILAGSPHAKSIGLSQSNFLPKQLSTKESRILELLFKGLLTSGSAAGRAAN